MSDKTLPFPKKRNLFFSKQVDQESIEKLSKEIIEINHDDEYIKKIYAINDLKYKPKPIKIFIDSYGGVIYQCFGLVGIMENSETPVYTYVTGTAMSAGFLILICGHRRFSYPLATPLYHQLTSEMCGNVDDVENELFEMKRLQKKMEDIIIKKTKITKEKLQEIDGKKRDWFITPKQALKLGVIDEILAKET